ncbi:MAG: hypothetical protein H6577_08645 [Lewinellaceae bacterium]|nr:hypothetical protein [Saprospiraceae bacterium]MCB9338185.1 hypothetical protein [Lewinellaceae bacterium]
MKKYLLFGLLALVFTAAFTNDALAQKKGKKKKSSATDEYFDESGFVNKLWYGGSFTLGYSGTSSQSYFAFGLAPMVGYKLFNDIVSVGPRVGFEYNNVRLKYNNKVYKANPLSYSVGAFARIKPFQNFFAHLEYEYQNADSTDPDEDGYIELDPQTDKILTTRVAYDNVYVGAGYNSGGNWAYEILILFNVNQPATTVASPFNIRFGFTHKF